jgi:hypothetical protein
LPPWADRWLAGAGWRSDAGIGLSQASIERAVLGWAWNPLFSTNITTIINAGIVPLIVAFNTSTGVATSGNTDPATITQVVTDWINGVNGFGGAAAWKPFEKYMILNICQRMGSSKQHLAIDLHHGGAKSPCCWVQ